MASEELCSTEQTNHFTCTEEIVNQCKFDALSNSDVKEDCIEETQEPKDSNQLSSTDTEFLLDNDSESTTCPENPEVLEEFYIKDEISNLLSKKADVSSELLDDCEPICNERFDEDSGALEVSIESSSLTEYDYINNETELEASDGSFTSYDLDEKVCSDKHSGEETDHLESQCLQKDDNANTTFSPPDSTDALTDDEELSNNNQLSTDNEDDPPNAHYESENEAQFEMDPVNPENDPLDKNDFVESDTKQQFSGVNFSNPEVIITDFHTPIIDQQNNVCIEPSVETLKDNDAGNVQQLICADNSEINEDNNSAGAELLKDSLSSIPILEESETVKTTIEEPQHLQHSDAIKVPESDQTKEKVILKESHVSSAPIENYAEHILKERNVVEFSDILSSGSPMLRRSLCNNAGQNRQDCRFLFGESTVDVLSEAEDLKYKSVRDSLDISRKNLSSTQEEDELATDDEQESAESTVTKEASQNPETEISKDTLAMFTKSISYKKKKVSLNICKGRRVSFPENDTGLITSYLEPVDPWFQMNDVTTDDISNAYQKSCNRHSTRALPLVLQQIIALPVQVGGRIERLSLRHQRLEGLQVECLEEIFRRVQFKTLDFEECSLEDDTAIPLFDMIEFYDSSCHLNISGNSKIGVRGWQACARMLKRTPSLRLFDARDTNLNEQNMPILCRALRTGTRLHTLHLENCNLTGRPLINLAGALRLNDTICDLYLGDNRLGSSDCIQLGNLVKWNKTLKMLDLRNNNIQDTGCVHICNEITEQQSTQKLSVKNNLSTKEVGLMTLNLWNNHLTINSIPHLDKMLSASVVMETLNLGRNYLTSEGILLLKNALMRNRTLKILGLQSTRLGNEGAVALAECIADNPVITRIDLRENSIQVAGLMALSRSLAMNSTIIQLDLDSNPRAEPSQDLSSQHVLLQQEIKGSCQKNQTEVHRNTPPREEREEAFMNFDDTFDPRKISLTCDSTDPKSVPTNEKKDHGLSVESKRYWSPAPSPSISPCPSPCPSPSPSPMPSPLKNRFKVFKVAEDILSTSAPASLSHSMSRSLPSLSSNRFLSGKRFTVTKVSDPSAPCRAMSSPSLIAPIESPTIVVSCPSNLILDFDEENKPTMGVKMRSNSVDLSLKSSPMESPSSDDVFEPESSPVKVVSERRLGVCDSPCLNILDKCAPLPKAPLAAMEVGSFDSDSEDSSEVTTQSSDSTHSDEVKISSTNQMEPINAWDAKQDQPISHIEPLKEGDCTH